MWQTWITLVRGVTAASKRRARSSRDGGGTGKAIFFSTIPLRFTRCSQVSSMRP